MEFKNEVIDFVCKTLSVSRDELKEDVKLYDSIGVDSTEMVELVVALAKRFSVKLETNEITKFSTPRDIVGILEKKK